MKINRKEYKFFLFSEKQGKIIEGFEYKEDARDRAKEISLSVKVFTKSYLMRIKKNPDINENWGTEIQAESNLFKDQYVKLHIKGQKHWLHVKTDKKGIPQRTESGLFTGVSLKDKKRYEFCSCDVIAFYEGNIKEFEGLGMPYIPAADVCNVLDTIVPDSMGYETHISVRIVQESVGKNLNTFVAEKLRYSEIELCKALSAEQVDAVALAIYNIEVKKQGMIIGDQTGIGKGRVAASMIRYGHYNGMKPIFISEKPNLFTDIYRDLSDIGSAKLVPFIINGREAKTDIKNAEGEVVYQALAKPEQERIFLKKEFPKGYDFACATYSQFSSPEKSFVKPQFLAAIAQDNLIIMDESHNASGTSNTGEFLRAVLKSCRGVVFLSATFAKRPDNMPVYAAKTAISDANMNSEQLVEAITKGGVALQELLSAQLVSEGQMIRRERSFEGVEVNYITLSEKETEHKAVYDNITSVLRDIIDFQRDYVSEEIAETDKIAAAEGDEAEATKGTDKSGIDNPPFFSKVFQVVNQMLFSIKARSVAEIAIERLEQGKKPIIAFSSTMESFFDNMQHADGRPVAAGDTVNLDYALVLRKGLDGVMKYTVIKPNGDREHKLIDISTMSPEAQSKYAEIIQKINSVSSGISISPIDVIKDTIRKAGYSCDEVTGRKFEVQLIDGKKGNYGLLKNRKKILANDAFRMFNDNELDCLLINQSGSTGASAHAIVTKKVPREKVKQRVMIVLQPELDINREVQKRGRINRTGQFLKPIYDYVTSAIPAERRLMMMLRKKLKSLDANTTSNQKQSENLLTTDDFLNKYGDKVVLDYLFENPELNKKLDDPLKIEDKAEDKKPPENAAAKVSGRVAVLTTEEQERFYGEILERYNDFVEYLRQTGEYDLEIEAVNFEAETKESKTVIEGRSGKSVFAENTYLEKVEVNNLKKPFSAAEIQNLIAKNLDGGNAREIQQETLAEVREFYRKKVLLDTDDNEKKYDALIDKIPFEKDFRKLKSENEKTAYIEERTEQLNAARKASAEMIQKKAENLFQKTGLYLNFFYIGRALSYPDMFDESAQALCLGVHIDRKKRNPYTPSAIKIKVAIASSDKYIDLTLSGAPSDKLNKIMVHSQNLSLDGKDLIADWDYYCRESNLGRKTVYIVTGNILQAYTMYTGKLISFTAKDGSVRKGMLMPDNFDPLKEQKNFVSVPIHTAEKYILNMSNNAQLRSTDGKVFLAKYYGFNGKDYFLSVPANKNYHSYIKDDTIIKLSLNPRDGFEKRSSSMLAYFETKNIVKLINHLSDVHKLSVSVSPSVYDTYFEHRPSLKTKSRLQEKAEQVLERDKSLFDARRNSASAQISSDKAKRLRIAKVKAIAKLKLLTLIK